MTLSTILDSISEYLGLTKPIDTSEDEPLETKIQPSGKSVCFVCYYGAVVSPIFTECFKDYLHNQGIRNVQVFNSGIDFIADKSSQIHITNSDLVVVLLDDIQKRYVRKLNPRGEIRTLKEICNDSCNKWCAQWEPKVYEYLVKLK